MRITAILLIVLLSLITIFFGLKIRYLEFDYRFENLFPLDDPELKYYDAFKKKLGSDSDFFLIALHKETGIFDSLFLAEVHRISVEIIDLENVNNLFSPTTITNPVLTVFGLRQKPLLNFRHPAGYFSDSVNIYQRDYLVNSLFSSTGKSVCIYFENDTAISKSQSDRLLASLDDILNSSKNIDQYHIAGKLYGQDYYLNYMVNEFKYLLIFSIVLLITFMALSYRSVWAIILATTIVLFTLVWLLGIMSISGISMNIFTIVLPTIIFVVGISDVVHILEKYLEELRNGTEKVASLKKAILEIGKATFLTSFTTAVGFATLMLTDIQPVRELGLFSAIGVFTAYILTILLLPSVYYLIPVPGIVRRPLALKSWNKLLGTCFIFVLRRQWHVLVVTLIIIGLSIVFLFQIKVDNYLLEDFRAGNPIKKSYSYIENNFGGFRSLELSVTLNSSESTIFTVEHIREFLAIENFLKERFDCEFIASPLSMLRMIRMAEKGGLVKHYILPDGNGELESLLRSFNRHQMLLPDRFISEDQRTARFSGKIKDIGGFKMRSNIKAFHEFREKEFPDSSIEYKFTGYATLIDRNNSYLVKNMLSGLMIAFVTVSGLMSLISRSARMFFIAIIPNVIPLILVAGVIGLFSINLNVATSIIFTIAFGIAVDDSIHFISRFRLEKSKGLSTIYALKRTYMSTGKALILTSLILSTGFLGLITAEMMGTFYIGMLISISLLFAVLCDLLLLPILLNKAIRD